MNDPRAVPVLSEMGRHPLIGHSPGLFESLAGHPELLSDAWMMYGRTLEQGALQPVTKAFMGLVMAEGMGARPLRDLQMAVLGRLGRPADQVESQLRRLAPDLPDPRGPLLMELARAAIRPDDPERMHQAGLRLRQEGAPDEELVEAAFTAGVYYEMATLVNAMAALAGASATPPAS